MDEKTTTLARANAHSLNLARRVSALQQALSLAEGRIDRATADKAREVLQRAGRRTAISGEKTVVALAGPTGAGKSSLFNALTGKDFAEVAVKRPTTSKARAVAWGSEAPTALLEWLEIDQYDLIESSDPDLTDLILIDLPDYDSIESAHRETVDRLVKVVDALIWVVDPEKYADAALHEGYLQPLCEYAEVMMVAFNKSDQLSEADMNRCVRDLRVMLNKNRLEATRIVVTAAVFDTGVPSLLDVVKRTVAAKIAMVSRISRDVRVAAYSIEIELGKTTPVVNRRMVADLAEAVSDVAQVGETAAAVEAEWLSKGWAITGWPFVSKRYRRENDPLWRVKASKKVQVDLTAETSPESFQGSVGRARVQTALDGFADLASSGLPTGWKRSVSAAAHRQLDTLVAQLADIAAQKPSATPKVGWWNVFRAAKLVCLVAVIAGLAWLLSGPIFTALSYPPLPALTWLGLPAPLLLIGAGIVLGVLFGLLARLLVRPGARRMSATITRRMLDQVEAVVQAQAADPVQAELKRLTQAQTHCRTAIG